MKEGTPFNVNAAIWVRLNDEGKRVFCEYYQRSGGTREDVLRIFRVQEDGWVKMQMFALMKIFGPRMDFWKEPPFADKFYLIAEDKPPRVTEPTLTQARAASPATPRPPSR